MPDEMAAFAINAGKIYKLFSSHRPLEQRMKALEQAPLNTYSVSPKNSNIFVAISVLFKLPANACEPEPNA